MHPSYVLPSPQPLQLCVAAGEITITAGTSARGPQPLRLASGSLEETPVVDLQLPVAVSCRDSASLFFLPLPEPGGLFTDSLQAGYQFP